MGCNGFGTSSLFLRFPVSRSFALESWLRYELLRRSACWPAWMLLRKREHLDFHLLPIAVVNSLAHLFSALDLLRLHKSAAPAQKVPWRALPAHQRPASQNTIPLRDDRSSRPPRPTQRLYYPARRASQSDCSVRAAVRPIEAHEAARSRFFAYRRD
ncbi:hypothetical protein BJY59DRAFT_210299 [Rhodotorula toruloides]